MNAAIFCASVVAIVAIGWWAVRQIRRGVKVRAEAITVLDCGCHRNQPIYGCVTCGDERCYVHQNAVCSCEERVTTHEHDPAAAEVDAFFKDDWEAWELELKEKAE